MKNHLLGCIIFLLAFNAKGQKAKDEPISFRDDLSIQWKKSKDTLKLIAKSKALDALQIFFHSKDDAELIDSFLLLPSDSILLLEHIGVGPDSVYKERFIDSIRLSYYFGHPSLIRPDLDYLYRLPFKKGKRYEVTQSFNGKVSHSNVKSKYAIDFHLDVGEPVFAAREGKVIKVIDWFTKHGGEEFKYKANKIVILHKDGTRASYVHLDYKGSFVKEGQWVQRGDKIGISGLTGYTSGPHLHFVVRKEKDISIPIYFEGYENKILKQGRRYRVKK